MTEARISPEEWGQMRTSKVRRLGASWLLSVGLALLALVTASACSTAPSAGSAVTDVRQALADGTERALAEGSVRFTGTSSFGSAQSIKYDGVLSWSNGATGEMTVGSGSAPPMVTRFTRDAIYSTIPPELSESVSGKRWLRQSFAELTASMGAVGELLRAALSQANPVRSAAMLVQAGDLRVVGKEQRNGVSTTHYAGTIEVGKLVADLRLGLSEQVIAELRREFQASGVTSEQLDLWLDERGFPVRAEARTNDPNLGQTTMSADYRDYGGPLAIEAPPESEVLDTARLREQLGVPPPR
jgi:hypothetical protein